MNLLPSQCRICHSWPSEVLCLDCRRHLYPTVHRCSHCATPLHAPPNSKQPRECGTCLRHPPPLEHCLAAADYAYPWDDLITRLKFHEDTALASHLARQLLAQTAVTDLIERSHALLPMPLSRQRLQERGYNQAALIARALASRLNDPHVLMRIRHTRAQSDCNLAERLANVRHAFAIQPERCSQVAGRHWLLVDDVMTTGASLFEAARTLQQAGAASVSAVVLARTPAH
jgi:ComF family protein